MVKESTKENRKPGGWLRRKPKIDEKVREAIDTLEASLKDSLDPSVIRGFNNLQRKQFILHFEKSQEYKLKTYREQDDVIIKIFPVGVIKRLTEQKAQEVLMKGVPEVLPPMGSFERFVVHDYLKDRDGIKTESYGEGKDRHIAIQPLFGRSPKKAKRRLTR